MAFVEGFPRVRGDLYEGFHYTAHLDLVLPKSGNNYHKPVVTPIVANCPGMPE